MTVTFDDLTSRALDWSLDDFVAEANRLLPEVVPTSTAPSKHDVNARLVRHYTTEGVLPKPLKDGAQARYDTDHLVRLLALRRLLAEGFPSAVAGAFLARHDREALARFLLGELKVDLGLASGGAPAAPAALEHLAPAVRERLAAMRARAGLPPLDAPQAGRDEAPAPPADERATSAPGAAPARLQMRLDGRSAAPHDPPWRDERRRLASDPETDAERPSPSTTFTRYELLDGLELHVRDDFEDPTTPAGWSTLRDALLARLERIAIERSLRR